MTTKRFAARDFNDAGTNRAFKAGQELTGVTAGEIANYEHAGLVAAPSVKASAPAKAPAKRAARPKKASKPATAPAVAAPTTNTDKAPTEDA